MGFLEPWISLTTQAPPPPTPSGFWTFLGNLLTIVLVQGVTLFIFYNKLSDDRRKEESERNAAWEQFRQTKQAEVERDSRNLRMNMKREVYMEVAPAIQQSSALLAEFLRINVPVEKIQRGIGVRQKEIQRVIAKIVPVASDDTLDAMRALQASILNSQVRLVRERATFDASKTAEAPNGSQLAMHLLFNAWVGEIEVFPQLMGDLASSIRRELEMPFDRKRFEDGMRNTNNEYIQMLRNELLRNG